MEVMPRARAAFVCQSCRLSQARSSRLRHMAIALQTAPRPLRPFSTTGTQSWPREFKQTSSQRLAQASPSVKERRSTQAVPPDRPVDPATTLQSIGEDAREITSHITIPDKVDVLELLERCLTFAQALVFGRTDTEEGPTEARDTGDGPVSALLDLDEKSSPLSSTAASTTSSSPSSSSITVGRSVSSASKPLSLAFRTTASTALADIAYNLLLDPKIYITPEMLQLYVRTQCLLGKPERLPKIFRLYAQKPIPTANTAPIRYRAPWPSSPQNAVPIDLSDAALEAAIQQKDLELALAIIDATVCAPAFRMNKLLRRASPPALFLGLTPVCAYMAASAFAEWQNTWDAEMATTLAMAGSLAYIGTLATVGFVAVTTGNDQMERVVWRPGSKLRDRWLREEERLYFDRVALAWGFKDRRRRGEEQGEDWDTLREWVGHRGMVLDKTSLMEGME